MGIYIFVHLLLNSTDDRVRFTRSSLLKCEMAITILSNIPSNFDIFWDGAVNQIPDIQAKANVFLRSSSGNLHHLLEFITLHQAYLPRRRFIQPR